ncbi:hypothetical protein L207DRAFT_549508 [Hyaloscypha variabilis F]|uniref:Acyltransferase 3 domain-containing protein n=1 Tax=Hyaloscypha variabilis (strain UAMH 11265 / GT02V1 / F) TaxID=1149755 RepID=A0A2J6QVL1_HYAVF|nr:hypothetical protein L207DRAFT_549508 [Hyaloscypha variabilis F]
MWLTDLLRPAILTRGRGGKQQNRRTAYLDGLRGFAAFLVYWHHHQLWPRQNYLIMGADYIFENSWGFGDNWFFAAMPVARTFFTGGHFAVSVFFVISGYVLSAKPLSLIYSNDHAKLGDNLSSALFRRWLRLYIPVFVTTVAYFTSWHLFGIWTVSPNHEANFRDELWKFYVEFKNYSFAFRTGGEDWLSYNFPTWSIPVEFRGSLIIYTSILGLSRCTKNMRLLGMVGLIFYFMYIVDGWFGSLFMAGSLLCQLDLLARNDDLPRIFKIFERYKTPIYYTFFIVSMFLSGVPSHSRDYEVLLKSPGWKHIAFLTPQATWDFKWFYLFWAAVFIVSAIPRIWWLKAFFELRFNQYLGRISFSLYLIHGPVLWTIGDRLYVATGWYRPEHEINTPFLINAFPLSKKGPLGLEPSFLVPHIILLPFTFWVAEVVTKLIDEPSVRFAAWLYNKMKAPIEQQK